MSEEKVRKIFSKNLTNQLSTHGKTQKDLIDFIHVSSSTVSNWCTGQKLPRMDKIQAIATWLNVSTSDLIEEKPSPQPHKIDINNILSDLIDKINEKEHNIFFDGGELSESDAEMLKDELEMMLRRLKIFNRNKKAD